MKTKEEIVQNWLPRYTGEKLDNFGKYVLLTNFSNYVGMFAEWNNVEIVGQGKPMQCATADNISIINFGMGSPNAATVMDCLSAIQPKGVLFPQGQTYERNLRPKPGYCNLLRSPQSRLSTHREDGLTLAALRDIDRLFSEAFDLLAQHV